MSKIAIVGIFFDGYYDIWEDFLELKSRFWPDCPYPTYLVNNNKDLEFKKEYDVTVLHAGADAEFSRRVQTAVENIDADYLLLLLEDFFFSMPIETDPLQHILSYIEGNNISYYSMPIREFVGDYYFHKKVKHAKHLRIIRSSDEYTVTCQPAIWSKDFLKKCIGTGNYNAWVFEGIYTKSTLAHSNEFLSKCMVDTRNVLALRHGALQSKILPVTMKYYNSIGYVFRNKRPTMSSRDYAIFKIKTVMKLIIPYNLQVKLKKLFNANSVIERYGEDIENEMKRMKIN